jgi:multiple sugar transport system permease protein
MSARALALRGSLRSLSADRRAAIAFALPAAVLLVVLILYPLVYGIALSVQRITATLSDGFVGVRNYSGVFRDGGFWHSVLVTAEFSVAALVLEFGLGLGLALMLARIVRGGGVIRTLILIPTMLTPAVAATNFRMMLNYDVGVINYVIGLLGFSSHPWVSDPNTALIALVLTDIWRNTPFFALVLGAGRSSSWLCSSGSSTCFERSTSSTCSRRAARATRRRSPASTSTTTCSSASSRATPPPRRPCSSCSRWS